MDYEALLAEKDHLLAARDAKIAMLESELAQLKRMIFGQQRERFIPDSPSEQLALDLGELPEAASEADTAQQVSYTRQQSASSSPKHPGRLPFPAHLPRETVVIEPNVDTTGMVRIGEAVTETLELVEARFFVYREVRPKYLEKTDSEEQIHAAELPDRPFPKLGAGVSVLVQILLSKYVDHLPLYRQRKIFLRDQVSIPTSTLSDWVAAVCDLLEPLYETLRKEVLKQEYLMADESRMPVQDRTQSGKTHLGYQWVYFAPLTRLVLFDYQKGRGKTYPQQTLQDFEGYLQTDGYEVYDALFEHASGVTLLGCMAHARRYFEKALDNDRERASYALTLIQQLYQLEAQAREAHWDAAQRYALRQQYALPLLHQLAQWAQEEYPNVLPKSLIGKALGYYLKRKDKLSAYTQDGRLEIDNNYVENAIRPLALGRKNYLFAGSHQGARRAAMIYSFLGSCEKCQIEPRQWLTDVLNHIALHPVNQLEELLPHQWQPADSLVHKMMP